MCFFSNCRYVQYGIMPGHKKDYFLCILCSKRTKPSDRRKINQNIRKYLRRKFLIEAPSENSVICNRCRHVYRTETQGTKRSDVCTHVPCTSVLSSEDQNKQKRSMSSPPSVSLPLASTAKSHAYIAVCAKSQDQSWWLLQQRVEQQFLLRKIFLYHQETDVVLLICMMGCLPVMLSNNFKQLKILS